MLPPLESLSLNDKDEETEAPSRSGKVKQLIYSLFGSDSDDSDDEVPLSQRQKKSQDSVPVPTPVPTPAPAVPVAPPPYSPKTPEPPDDETDDEDVPLTMRHKAIFKRSADKSAEELTKELKKKKMDAMPGSDTKDEDDKGGASSGPRGPPPPPPPPPPPLPRPRPVSLQTSNTSKTFPQPSCSILSLCI
jgi:hypothetical protein